MYVCVCVPIEGMTRDAEPMAVIEEGGETHRLALCNVDWDNLRAVDIYVLLESFIPPGRRCVYTVCVAAVCV